MSVSVLSFKNISINKKKVPKELQTQSTIKYYNDQKSTKKYHK